MTDRPELARAATDLLASQTERATEPAAAARGDAIAAIAAALNDRKQRARRRRVATVALASAAAAAAALVWARPRANPNAVRVEGQAQLVHEGAPLTSPRTLTAGDRIVGAGKVILATGTHVVLEQESDVGVANVGASSIFDVKSGRVRFEVAKLGGAERFVVRTSDAEVEVRGTVFAVSVVTPEARCGATPTRVSVREGVVVVRHGGVETKLIAGDSWPRCESEAPAAATTAAPKPPPTMAPILPSGSPPLAAIPKPTDLAAQNDLFAEGIAKKRGGDREGAIAAFDRLLSKWPGSAHAENASAERMRLATGPRAVTYAKAYLARFPHGFAASEARAIAGL